jgi:hypothetical protein
MTSLKLDPKAILGVVASVLGWIAANGNGIIPTLPVEYQHTAGTIVLFAGVALTLFAHPPKVVDVSAPEKPK